MSDDASPRWIWPFRIPPYIGRPILRKALALGKWLGPVHCWLAAGVVIGALPYALVVVAGWQAAASLSAVGLMMILAAATARDSLTRGGAAVGAAFVTHSAITIFLTLQGEDISWFPDGDAYWDKSRHWILTGINPEYDWQHWVPVHGILFLAVALATYPSLGFVTFYHGFYQLDLMNVYVGRLIAASQEPWIALAAGWHPWSLLRGVGLFFLTFEVVSLSLERLTGARLSTPARRRNRWLCGGFFLALDGAIKYFFLDAVRKVLADGLAIST